MRPKPPRNWPRPRPTARAANRYEKMINIKDQGQIFRVDVDTIERIDAAGDYMCIQTGDNTLILRETMKDLEKRLDPRRFQRVHRSTIVNLDLVRQVKPHTNGECFLVLEFGRAGEGVAQLSRRRGEIRPLIRRAWAGANDRDRRRRGARRCAGGVVISADLFGSIRIASGLRPEDRRPVVRTLDPAISRLADQGQPLRQGGMEQAGRRPDRGRRSRGRSLVQPRRRELVVHFGPKRQWREAQRPRHLARFARP